MDTQRERTSIQIYEKSKKLLDKYKIMEQEPYESVILRLIQFFEDHGDGKLPLLREQAR
ncbi:MAG: hypothetical protein QXU98_14370 [Candidatus Parvarchaeota archaeon]